MYKALYRKWRPLSFSDVVGQRHVTDTLKSELRAGRLSHAYLFTGTRGTGKTSCAKILARAVNCERPVDGDPCNVCPACRGILSGSILDITELDAASYSGVDNIRALRDESVYTPAAVQKRVYIIDEVHMLSIGAFNALLTILEDPPPHVLFILATTETHKVPATIVSRCQRFSFRRISPTDMEAHLTRVAQGENIDMTEEAGRILVRLADGAMRDALSLLDQCAADAQGKLDAAGVYAALGLAGLDAISELADAVAHRDAARALALLQSQYESGRDLASILDELCILLRDLLLSEYLADGRGLSGLDTASADTHMLAGIFGKNRLLHAITLLQETQGLMARGGNRRVDMELCLLRLCDERLSGDITALETRVAALEGHAGEIPVAVTQPAKQVAPPQVSPSFADTAPPWETASPPGTSEIKVPQPKPKVPEAKVPEAKEPETKTSASKTPDVKTPDAKASVSADFWNSLLDTLGNDISFMTRAILSRARTDLDEHRLTVCVQPFELKQMQDQALVSLLAQKAGLLSGHPVEVFVTSGNSAAKKGPDPLDDLIRRGGEIVQLTMDT